MSAPEPLELAAHWLATALGDLQAARTLLRSPRLPARQAAANAQQAAEKSLKGAIIASGNDPPFTHDLEALKPLVPGSSLVHRLDVRLERLSAAYTAARYPSYFQPPFGHEEAAALVADATAIVDAVLDDLKELGLSRPAPK